MPVEEVQDDILEQFEPALFADVIRAFRADRSLTTAEVLQLGRVVNDLVASAFDRCVERQLASAGWEEAR